MPVFQFIQAKAVLRYQDTHPLPTQGDERHWGHGTRFKAAFLKNRDRGRIDDMIAAVVRLGPYRTPGLTNWLLSSTPINGLFDQ